MSDKSFIGRALNRTFYYGFSSILGRIVGFLMLPIYTNYLTPEEYGVAGFLVFYISLVQILLGGKLELAISKLHYDKNISSPLGNIMLTATIFTVIVSIFPLAMSIIFASEISNLLFDSDIYHLAVMVMSFNIVFGTTELYGLRYLNISDKPKLYLALNLLKLMVQLFINIWLVVFMEIGILGVVISSATSSFLVSILSYSLIMYYEKRIYIEKILFKPLVVFSAPLWFSGLLGLYSGSISQVFISKYAGLYELGLYNLGSSFGALVAALAWTPFFSYWTNERFRIFEQNDAKEIYRKVFYTTAGLTLFLGLGISVFSDPIIRIMANESFYDATNVVAPLAIFNTVMYLGWFIHFSFHVTNNNKEVATNSIIYAVLITVSFFLLIPKWGYIGAAYGLLLSVIINLHILEWRSRKFYDMHISIIRVDIMILITLSLSLVFGLMNKSIDNAWISLVTSASLMAVFLVITAIIVHFKNPVMYQDFLRHIKSSIKVIK